MKKFIFKNFRKKKNNGGISVDYLKEVQLASLLHDIGKFWWRTLGKDERKNNRHPILSQKFIDEIAFPPEVDKNLVKILVLRHHDSEAYKGYRVSELPKGIERRLARIVSEADNISSAMDRDKDEEKDVERPLTSIFSEIKLSEKPGKEKFVYSPSPMNIGDSLFPQKNIKDFDDKIKDSWRIFCDEVKKIPKKNFDAWFNTMLYLLKKYTYNVPSASYEIVPNIPLYDHLKTTSGIAACLYKYCTSKDVSPKDESGESKRYLLIEGDISGIQKFIYRIANPQEARKHAAKRLRGRSFWIVLVMDAIVRKILKELKLYETNLLWNSGGHFLIIAPNLDKIKRKIEKISIEINKKIFEDYNGELFIAISWLECSKKDLIEFGKTLEKIGLETEKKKKQKFIEFLEYVMEKRGENVPLNRKCVVCGNKLFRDEKTCKICKKHELLGSKLAKSKYLCIGENIDCDFEFIGIKYKFIEKSKDIPENTEILLRINNTDFLTKNKDIAQGFIFVGNVVPSYRERKRILSFDEIAHLSKGAKKIGILKADVDNLGKIFLKGIEGRKAISKYHTLSLRLDLFFKGYLNKICDEFYVFSHEDLCEECLAFVKENEARKIEIKKEDEEKEIFYEVDEKELCSKCRKKKISKIYINYSGGDDLLIFGPWDTILKFADRMRSEFKRYVGFNSDINISAGVSIVNPKFPVSRAVKLADENLELAKSHLKNGKNEKIKNSIAVFGECVLWEDSAELQKKGFRQLLKLGKWLEERVSNEISKGFVYSLLEMWKRTFGSLELSELERTRLTRKRYVPLLKYKLARTFSGRKDKIDKINEYEEKIIPYMPWIRIPVSWVSLRRR